MNLSLIFAGSMKRMITLIIVLLAFIANGQAQSNFNVQIRQVMGDLNKDSLSDMVLITTDTTDETRPLKVEIFLSQPDSSNQLVASTTHLIEPMYPAEKNGAHSGHQVPNFSIQNGNLVMESYIRGISLHSFSYRNNSFELIGFSSIQWDGKNKTTTTEFNLQAGDFKKYYQLLGSDEVIVTEDKQIRVDSLPKLQNFIPFRTAIY